MHTNWYSDRFTFGQASPSPSDWCGVLSGGLLDHLLLLTIPFTALLLFAHLIWRWRMKSVSIHHHHLLLLRIPTLCLAIQPNLFISIGHLLNFLLLGSIWEFPAIVSNSLDMLLFVLVHVALSILVRDAVSGPVHPSISVLFGSPVFAVRLSPSPLLPWTPRISLWSKNKYIESNTSVPKKTHCITNVFNKNSWQLLTSFWNGFTLMPLTVFTTPSKNLTV